MCKNDGEKYCQVQGVRRSQDNVTWQVGVEELICGRGGRKLRARGQRTQMEVA